jgi:uncharacterized protein YbcI
LGAAGGATRERQIGGSERCPIATTQRLTPASSSRLAVSFAAVAGTTEIPIDLKEAAGMQSTKSVQQRPHAHGDVLTAISDGMVALLKEFYGYGPTRTKSYYADDLVVCVLRGGFSRVEETLLEGGRGAAVIQQRMEFQELMRERFEQAIERATGRPVIGFMSGNQQHPDMMCEVFILAPTDLLDEHDIPANGRSSPLG